MCAHVQATVSRPGFGRPRQALNADRRFMQFRRSKVRDNRVRSGFTSFSNTWKEPQSMWPSFTPETRNIGSRRHANSHRPLRPVVQRYISCGVRLLSRRQKGKRKTLATASLATGRSGGDAGGVEVVGLESGSPMPAAANSHGAPPASSPPPLSLRGMPRRHPPTRGDEMQIVAAATSRSQSSIRKCRDNSRRPRRSTSSRAPWPGRS